MDFTVNQFAVQCPQKTHPFGRGPSIDGYGKNLCTTLLQCLEQVWIGHAIFLKRNTKSLHRAILIKCRHDFNPSVWFRHGDVWFQAQCLESCLRFRSSGDDDDLLQGSSDVCHRVSSLQYVEEEFGADAGQ